MKILAVYDDSVAADVRIKMPMAEMERRGLQVTVKPYNKTLPGDFIMHDQVIFQRPIVDLTGPFALARKAGARVIVEVDDDFRSIPKDHPGYSILGLGNQPAYDRHQWAIQNADLVTTTTPTLAARLCDLNRNTVVIPNSWDDTNQRWFGPKPGTGKYQTINIGWAGSMTHRKDLYLIIRPLVEIARTQPDVRIVVGADMDFYLSLAKIPEKQKLFLPGLKYQLYPWIIRHFDIMLAPLEDNYFTRAKSDIKLVEAGAAGIPYIASAVEPYKNWYESTANMSGCLVDPTDEGAWYRCMEELVKSEALRTMMGNGGKVDVDRRRITQNVLWEKVCRGML